MNQSFARFPWRDDPNALEAWQQGKTGFPFVDAGMRQLWTTGWMHSRVRMVVGSFLVKGLVIPWQSGARWFWDTLVDADLANNTMGWQWVAGCGADAAPFFRIFNPVGQGERCDPYGAYVRQWVPELAKLPDRWIHKPWQAPQAVLREAGVTLGKSYPAPMVDHDEARKKALELLKKWLDRKQGLHPAFLKNAPSPPECLSAAYESTLSPGSFPSIALARSRPFQSAGKPGDSDSDHSDGLRSFHFQSYECREWFY